ncbi:SGNH/GDSL hydrolase family protein [Lignipirellula cremea]|uniref:SGNH hydrolase-type esterase domain-containing protein n=1 Tax=Lignipirellula cremea TaxID=2528010 RepID=A0A518E267_9BACT|nr:SGNH/GDSL hydrolase family protein [Lignipirellula cremea]QDU98152.1 hypothetical protein Pla8534_60130 [Lignipirellula cremea]
MQQETPSRRIVLLGASNVAKSISTAVSVAREGFPGQLDLLAAMGHGRAYTRHTSVLGRGLPAIVSCSLWSDLAARPPAPTTAVVMDVGNDIIFGATTEEVLAGVETCLDRLAKVDAQVTVVGLPLASLERLGPWRFQLFLRLFFPFSRLEYADGMQTARATHQRLKQLAADQGATFVPQRGDWYGVDPIHLRRSFWSPAWKNFFSFTSDAPAQRWALGSPGRFLYLRTRSPALRKWWNWEQRGLQPCGRLASGVDLSWY